MTLQNPEFIMYVGPMFSGKTGALISLLDKHKYQKKSCAVFKSAADDRYNVNAIVCHTGLSVPAQAIHSGDELLERLVNLDTPPDLVAVDEAFMIPGIAETLLWLYKSGVSVAVSTLELSFNGSPFAEIKEMLPHASLIVKCKAVCSVCGADAMYTHKKASSYTDEEIQVGGDELYEPRCFSHHISVNQRDK